MPIFKRELSQWILIIVAVALLASNGFLIYQNLELRQAVARSKQFVTDVGYKFADLPGVSLSSENVPARFGVDGKSTVILVFNTNCQYCKQQYPYWKQLIDSLDRKNWHVVAVTSQSDSDFVGRHLEENDLAGLDVRILSSKEISEARLAYTPMTILVDAEGVVRNVWPGLWVKGFNFGN